MKFLTVKSIVNAQDTASVDCKKVTLQSVTTVGNRDIIGKTKVENIYGERSIVDKKTGEVLQFKAHPMWESSVGDYFEGQIATLDTTPYMIEGRSVNKITVVSLAGENPVDIANRNLKANNAKVITGNSSVLQPNETTTFAFAPESTEA